MKFYNRIFFLKGTFKITWDSLLSFSFLTTIFPPALKSSAVAGTSIWEYHKQLSKDYWSFNSRLLCKNCVCQMFTHALGYLLRHIQISWVPPLDLRECLLILFCFHQLTCLPPDSEVSTTFTRTGLPLSGFNSANGICLFAIAISIWYVLMGSTMTPLVRPQSEASKGACQAEPSADT